MNARPCPTCAGRGFVDDDREQVVRLKLDELELTCTENAIPIGITGTVTEIDAARLLDLAPNTLANWRHEDQSTLPYKKIGGRVRYELIAIARYLVGCEN